MLKKENKNGPQTGTCSLRRCGFQAKPKHLKHESEAVENIITQQKGGIYGGLSPYQVRNSLIGAQAPLRPLSVLEGALIRPRDAVTEAYAPYEASKGLKAA